MSRVKKCEDGDSIERRSKLNKVSGILNYILYLNNRVYKLKCTGLLYCFNMNIQQNKPVSSPPIKTGKKYRNGDAATAKPVNVKAPPMQRAVEGIPNQSTAERLIRFNNILKLCTSKEESTRDLPRAIKVLDKISNVG